MLSLITTLSSTTSYSFYAITRSLSLQYYSLPLRHHSVAPLLCITTRPLSLGHHPISTLVSPLASLPYVIPHPVTTRHHLPPFPTSLVTFHHVTTSLLSLSHHSLCHPLPPARRPLSTVLTINLFPPFITHYHLLRHHWLPFPTSSLPGSPPVISRTSLPAAAFLTPAPFALSRASPPTPNDRT